MSLGVSLGLAGPLDASSSKTRATEHQLERFELSNIMIVVLLGAIQVKEVVALG